jgi:hypothetical protein
MNNHSKKLRMWKFFRSFHILTQEILATEKIHQWWLIIKRLATKRSRSINLFPFLRERVLGKGENSDWNHCQSLSTVQNKRRWSWHRIRVIPPWIRLGTCSKCSIVVPSTTRRALSNGVIRFSIGQTIVAKKSKYCNFVLKFQHQIRVISPGIRLGTCSRCCSKYNSTSSIEWCNRFFKSSN